jgi:hypothetical protein
MKRHNGKGQIFCFGRLRFAWVSPSEWVETYPIRNWFFISRLYEHLASWDIKDIQKYWQMTILGFQIGFMYKGKPKKLH